MIADFLARLTRPRPEPLSDADARLALSALLIRVARADGTLDAAEASRIKRVITARYELTSTEATALFEEAAQLEIEAPDTVRFTRAIKEAVAYPDRIQVIEALWLIALADGVRDAEEDSLLRLVSNLLGVNDVDSALARQRVESGP